MPGIKNLEGKITVITGAGSTIGRATARAFAKEGAILVISDKHKDRLIELENELKTSGAQVTSMEADVSDHRQTAALSAEVLEKFGRVDILHNNAGIGWGGPSERFPVADFEKVIEVNLLSVVYGINCFLPQMIKQRSGHIVNMASAAGLTPVITLGAYTASKYAVVGYSEVLRAELRRHNIGVTAICPGIIKTKTKKDDNARLLHGATSPKKWITSLYGKYGWAPERVAEAVIKGIKKDKGIIPVGPEVWALWSLKRTSQSLSNLISSLSAKVTFRQ